MVKREERLDSIPNTAKTTLDILFISRVYVCMCVWGSVVGKLLRGDIKGESIFVKPT